METPSLLKKACAFAFLASFAGCGTYVSQHQSLTESPPDPAGEDLLLLKLGETYILHRDAPQVEMTLDQVAAGCPDPGCASLIAPFAKISVVTFYTCDPGFDRLCPSLPSVLRDITFNLDETQDIMGVAKVTLVEIGADWVRFRVEKSADTK
jgi:hypothetical protein